MNAVTMMLQYCSKAAHIYPYTQYTLIIFIGMRNQGCLNKFLCGCVDSDKSNGLKFMSVVYVNGQTTSNANLQKLLTNTGFFTNTENHDGSRNFGKWFSLDYGKLPDFLSQRTYQQSEEGANTGWQIKKHHYPDMWINPKDSFVLNINAGEIVSTKDFSSGVGLRFPRIRRIRANEFDEGPKSVEEIDLELLKSKTILTECKS